MTQPTVQRVAIYCGSRPGNTSVYQQVAEHLTQWLVQQQIGIVYGGGHTGLMGVVADTAIAAGGDIIGVLPHALTHREIPHKQVKTEYVNSMHERKARMAELADAFIALPGGIGTLDELIEIWCWSGMKHHQKPCICFDADHFWQPFFDLLKHVQRQGFSYHSTLPLRVQSVSELSQIINNHELIECGDAR